MPDESPNKQPRFCDIRSAWLQIAAQDDGLSLTDLRILVLLATRYADATTGECFPSQATISDALGKDRRTVQRALVRLESLGWFFVKRGRGRKVSSQYALCFGKVSDKVISIAGAKKGGVGAAFSDDKRRRGCRPLEDEKAAFASHKRRRGCRPNLNKEPIEEIAPLTGWLSLQRSDVQADHWHAWLADHGFEGFNSLPASNGDRGDERRVPLRFPPTANQRSETEAVLAWLRINGVRSGSVRGLGK